MFVTIPRRPTAPPTNGVLKSDPAATPPVTAVVTPVVTVAPVAASKAKPPETTGKFTENRTFNNSLIYICILPPLQSFLHDPKMRNPTTLPELSLH